MYNSRPAARAAAAPAAGLPRARLCASVLRRNVAAHASSPLRVLKTPHVSAPMTDRRTHQACVARACLSSLDPEYQARLAVDVTDYGRKLPVPPVKQSLPDRAAAQEHPWLRPVTVKSTRRQATGALPALE